MLRRLLLTFALAMWATAGTGSPLPWKLAQTRHFRVYARADEATIRGFTSDLARYDELLRRLSGLPADYDAVPVTIYVVPDMVAVARAGNTDWGGIAGFYSGSASEIFAVVPQKMEIDAYAMTAREVLFHEYAHHFMLENFPALYSSWYVEGFADFYSTVTFEPDGRAAVGRPLKNRLAGLQYGWGPSTREMLKPDSFGRTYGTTLQRYQRGWLLVHYLSMSPARGGQLKAYLTARAKGEDEEQAFRDGLHASFADMDRELMAYFRSHRMNYGLVPAPPPPDDLTIADVPPATAAVLTDVPRLRDVQETRRKKGLFVPSADVARDIGRAAAAWPDDAFVTTLHAEALYEDRQTDAAHAAAEHALALDPKDARAELVLARLGMDAAGKDATAVAAARRLIVKANRMAPGDPLPLLDYYRSFAAAGEAAPGIAVQGLARAQEIVPQDRTMRLLLARRYIDDKAFARAAALLRPVASDPHASDDRDAALALLKSIPGEATPVAVAATTAR